MKIQFHGHACFSIITDNGTHLLIDPFITGNSQAKISADTLNPDVILLTHGHWD
ncbi:MAG: MBL fold metallo-hydrolase, partial [Peptococcaceae bacterium]|nr:MBL fold metallo-hydrolase [Peptococcaceae bacterium]